MSTLPVRVMVQDAWDRVALELPATTTVQELKQKALGLTRQAGKPEDYQVKFRGAAVLDEGRSLAEAGVVPNAELIVLPRRRRPVR
ncbi:MAG: EsaB/YukD family protein [Gemmatimonadales bacterium]